MLMRLPVAWAALAINTRDAAVNRPAHGGIFLAEGV